jgi:uncharacterized RDD family membrane protein YckC/tRNA A-37 threonylcarbamoyl transferase component Bud32
MLAGANRPSTVGEGMSGAATESTLAPGTRLAHYEIRDVLGAGAMGTVYRAHDTALDRSVAVKVLRPRLAGEPALVDRFVREARAAARVNHPNLTHIYFVGAQDGSQFFAMEYVPGTTLEAEVAAHGPMPLARFVDVIVQSARGLAAAHGAGVIHRDVKPSNLMLLPNGTVKVTDFGLAKSLAGDVAASGGGMVLGTPTYMSPEQCRGKSADARTDVYALGLVAWFLLAGRPPFVSESIGQMIADQLNTPLPSVRELRPDLVPAIDRVLGKLCAKKPEDRPASMEEVAELFEELRPRPLETATFAARLFAYTIDMTIVTFACGVVLAVFAALRHWLNFDLPDVVGLAVSAALLFLEQYAFEAWLGTTPGKWLFNLEVVAADGSAPRRTNLLFRFLIRFPIVLAVLAPISRTIVWIVCLNLQAISYLIAAGAFAAYRGRTVSDLVTRTRVVHRSSNATRPAPESAPTEA